ncbi:MAG TPA: 4-hydroxy-tetrahydrodipicolinate synthase [Bacteroidales bacterium]|nr:4-hydroxy-tetrahydrodipicolinate synthase [Bacteroidales bacterium]
MTILKGTFTVLITPMTIEQDIDIEGLKSNINWQISKGIPGICVAGSTGEFASLTREERLEIAEVAVKHVNGRIPCLVGTAAESTRETIFYTKHAKEIGANGVLIINPYFCKPSFDDIYLHFKAISEAVEIPVMVYNNPGHSGVDMSPELLVKICSLKNIDYVKDASGDLRRVTDIKRMANGTVNIFCGGEDLAMQNFLLGATGWICVCGNIIPKEANQLLELVQQNRLEEANKLFDRFFPLLDMLENSPKALQLVKKSLEFMGHPAGPCRFPRQPLSESESEKLKNLLKNLNII